MNHSQEHTQAAQWWRQRMVWAAFATALVVRLLLVFTVNHSFTDGLELGYLQGALSMASGQGLLQHTQDVVGGQQPDAAARARQASGGRIDAEHPYPLSAQGYVPGTLHPPGYSLLLWGYYVIGNFDGMVMLMRITSALLDASVCVLLFIFMRNILGVAPALVAGWVWVFLPAPLLLLLTLKPDAFVCFFAALILCLASYTRLGRPEAWVATGAAVGVAFYFRPEFLAWPAVLFVCAWIDSGRLWRSVAGAAMLGITMLVLLSPWVLWTHHATGRLVLSTSSTGGSMYEALGEDPANPWGVTLDDAWLDRDARNRGFATAWSPAADQFYRKLYWQCVREHPGFWARNLVFNRLPVAVIPPYEPPSRDWRFFSDYRQREGLTRWGVVMKHPVAVLKHKGPAMLTAILSGLLVMAMLTTAVVERRRWRQVTWLVLPWLFVIAVMSLVKQVEPRNVAGTLVVLASAAGVAIEHFIACRQRTNGARWAQSSPTVAQET
jgi:4-amino-4-deoxy-L-arabinose transferase-like glycosyltransferase